MSRKVKLFFILFIIFSIIFSFYTVYATDIDMNLPGDTDISSPDPEDANVIPQSEFDDTPAPLVDTPSDSAFITPSSVDSIEEETLSFSNILSILLITVGVILILLAIAIIIRLK